MSRNTFAALVLCFLALAGRIPAKLRIAATLPDLGWIAEQVGGEDAEVTVLCPGPMDPHYLPAKPSLARRLARADLLVYNGLELEIGWLPLLIDAARNPRVRPGAEGELDCSTALQKVLDVPEAPLDRSQGDVHPLGNPHYTRDPRNCATLGRLMAGRMAELDPDRAEYYRRRAAELDTLMAGLIEGWERRAVSIAGHPLIVYHRSWIYLREWLGLESAGEIEHRPGITPSPRHVGRLIKKAGELEGVIVIAAQWQHIDAAREVAQRIGAPLAVLPGQTGALPGAEDYPSTIETIIERLARAAGETVIHGEE